MNPRVERLLDLAAQVTEAERPALLERESADPREQAEVAALLAYAAGAETFFDQAIQGVAWSLQSGSEPRPGDRIGSYRIVSQIGRGGMGSVYLAERADGELQQRVAIKLLRADNHRNWRERFLMERQMLASLNHPSVVHVIDAGHTDDGRPFLAMEYVNGVPIDRYAAGIGVRDRLKLLLRVCEGVSHAHRQLIIHRDLKPSNILVDATGQPKLLDFGIAKLLSATGDETQTLERVLTPDYASPEQFRGEAQTTATDIYSLAAVLYKILTGVTPRENPREAGKPEAAPPSHCNPAAPRDLDFVVAKALRMEPEHRYSSVDEFAADLRAVLDFRPVKARDGELWYRGVRFLRRRWMPLGATLAVTVGLAAGLWIAERERRVAERRFAEVRQLSSKLFDIDAQVAQLPGASRTRQFIVDTALEYLTRVSRDVRIEPDLALDLATAYMRAARVQGVNISTNLGQTEPAERTERKAQAMIDAVLAAQPANPVALLRAGQIAHDRMILAGDGHHDAEALQLAKAAAGRLDAYVRIGVWKAPANRQDAQQAILAFINIANRYLKADQFEESMAMAGKAIELAEASNWPAQAGAARIVLAQAYRATGDLDEALAAIREAERLLAPAEGETSTGRIQAYGLALLREGQILGDGRGINLGRRDEAAERIGQALALGEEVARLDASDFQSQYRVFSAETKLAGILRDTQPARALTLYDDGLRRMETAPANAGTPRNEVMALALGRSGPLLRLGRRVEGASTAGFGPRPAEAAGNVCAPAAKVDLGSPASRMTRCARWPGMRAPAIPAKPRAWRVTRNCCGWRRAMWRRQ